MANNKDWSTKDDMELLAKLVALFGVQRGTDWFFVWTLIKLAVIIGFLVYCFCR